MAAGLVEYFDPDRRGQPDVEVWAAAERHGVRRRVLSRAIELHVAATQRKADRLRLRQVVLANPDATDEQVAAVAGVDVGYVRGHRPGILNWAATTHRGPP